MEYKRLEIERIDFDDMPNWMEDPNEMEDLGLGSELSTEWKERQEKYRDIPGCPNGPGCVSGK